MLFSKVLNRPNGPVNKNTHIYANLKTVKHCPVTDQLIVNHIATRCRYIRFYKIGLRNEEI